MSSNKLENLIDRRMNRMLRKKRLGKSVSVRVNRLESGATVYVHRKHKALIPASTQKMATAAGILNVFDRDDRFHTKVVQHGRAGNRLTLVGGGDPLLSSKDIANLAKDTARSLQKQGFIGKYHVGYDASMFATPTAAPGWPSSYLYTYSAPAWALSRDRRTSMSAPWDAARYFRDTLRKRLERKGFNGKVAKALPSRRAANLPALHTFSEHTFGSALWAMLRYSNNSIAEVLLRHIAHGRGKSTSAQGSAAALADELRSLGVRMTKVNVADGSGLSRWNRLPVRTQTDIVRITASDPDFASIYHWGSVPTSGYTGTLGSRFTGKAACARGKVMAKTGTLSNVVALSGIAAGRDGQSRAFSILVNNKPSGIPTYRVRQIVDRMAASITGC